LPILPTDHFQIICLLKIINSPIAPITKHLTCAIRAINITELCHDILSSCLTTHPPSALADLLVDCYNSTLFQLSNKHTPLKSKIIHTKPSNPWFTQALKKLRLANRHPECIWSHTHCSEVIKLAYNHYHAAIIIAKRTCNCSLISSSYLAKVV